MPQCLLKSLVCVLVLLLGGGTALASPAAGTVEFNRDVRPILTANCFDCHGPDPVARKAGLRFDREDGFFTQRDHGTPVVKGHPEESLIYKHIISTDPKYVMPRPSSHRKLTAAQKETIRAWIAEGAPWQPHWSLVAPKSPALPTVADAKWCRNPIDHFVLARLEAAGLSPAPEADRRTLARRASLDATGLPPDPAQVEALVADKSPGAYERYVKRLLDSPAYGEQRAHYWLDAVRYADTHGFHYDNYVEVWPYRDWVIGAFNSNMPFDRFTTKQLAGDLLPNPTHEDLIASGYNRLNETTNEGGTIPEENLVMYTRDRTETTAHVWLGLTANCAVCHDHKYDPISQHDFYAFSAFFNNLAAGALDGNVANSAPAITIFSPEDQKRLEAVKTEIASIQRQQRDHDKTLHTEFERWLATAKPGGLVPPPPTDSLALLAPLDEGTGSTTHITLDGTSRELNLPPTAKWVAGYNAGHALRADKGAIAELPDVGDFEASQPFTVAVWVKLPKPNVTGSILARMDNTHDYRGWDVWVEGGRVGMHIINHWPSNADKVVSTGPLPAGWNHVCVSYDGSGKAKGIHVYINGIPEPVAVANNTLHGSIRTKVPLKIGQRQSIALINGLEVQALRIYERALTVAEAVALAGNSPDAILAKAPAARSNKEKQQLFGYWVGMQKDPEEPELKKKLASAEAQQKAINARGNTMLVSKEKSTPAKAYILSRGEYDKRGEEVKPDTFSALPPIPAGEPHTRLTLAHWLFRPENPLTARVTVNRYWQQVFGTGIVKTSEDFGIMGEPPSHPKLLDWLAVEFRESGWNTRHMFELMLTSATYRQAATITPEKLEKDPEDRLLSRGPRFRMDGEMVRDYALAVSGLLVQKIGGPPVRPYQPPGIWNVVGMPGGNTRNYKQDTGEGLYRRSIYTFWKRQAPPPSMEEFNAPSRETCTVRRERTDTPLQALVTMNDTQFIEAARRLAELALKQGGPDTGRRIDWLVRRVLDRPVRDAERPVLRQTLDDLLTMYKSRPADAAKLIAVGESKADPSLAPPELAAWTMVASDLLNLDEALNK